VEHSSILNSRISKYSRASLSFLRDIGYIQVIRGYLTVEIKLLNCRKELKQLIEELQSKKITDI
jgi:hypothetical protein